MQRPRTSLCPVSFPLLVSRLPVSSPGSNGVFSHVRPVCMAKNFIKVTRHKLVFSFGLVWLLAARVKSGHFSVLGSTTYGVDRTCTEPSVMGRPGCFQLWTTQVDVDISLPVVYASNALNQTLLRGLPCSDGQSRPDFETVELFPKDWYHLTFFSGLGYFVFKTSATLVGV